MIRGPQVAYLIGASPVCSQIPGLSSGQMKLCQLYQDHMHTVLRGGKAATAECQYQFKNRRWNCSTAEGSTIFGPVIRLGKSKSVVYFLSLSLSLFGFYNLLLLREILRVTFL